MTRAKHAALSRQTVKLNALTSSPPAPQPCHHGYALLPNWRPSHHQHTLFGLPIHPPQPTTSRYLIGVDPKTETAS